VRVVVVGAGVVGRSCAVLLAENGHTVEVRTSRQPPDTTSAVAAALWYPYRAHPRERVTAWSARTYAVLRGFAEGAPGSGVRMRAGTELLRCPAARPWWADAVENLRAVETPPAGYTGGWRFTAPVVDMGTYLPWLVGRLHDSGAQVVRERLAALPIDAEVVVHASGLGARELVGDDTMQPVRGQVVVLEQWGLSEWWLDGSGITYVVPREREAGRSAYQRALAAELQTEGLLDGLVGALGNDAGEEFRRCAEYGVLGAGAVTRWSMAIMTFNGGVDELNAEYAAAKATNFGHVAPEPRGGMTADSYEAAIDHYEAASLTRTRRCWLSCVGATEISRRCSTTRQPRWPGCSTAARASTRCSTCSSPAHSRSVWASSCLVCPSTRRPAARTLLSRRR